MADKKTAEKNYKLLCKMFDKKGWKYEKDEAKYKVSCSADGDNGSYNIRMFLNADREVAVTWVFIDLTVPESMKETMALAVNMMNRNIIHGAFDYGQAKGNLLYRCTSTFRESIVSEDWFEYLLDVATITTDAYMDKFRRLVKGYLTLEELQEELNK